LFNEISFAQPTLAVAYAENWGWGSYGGRFYLVSVVCDVMFLFSNQHYNGVCRHKMHILLQALSLFHVSLHLIETISSPS